MASARRASRVRARRPLLIVSCDDLGACHASNIGVYDALHNGVGTSADADGPGPWAREAAARYRGEDVGVHLTLNAEHELYRWGPITHAPSLLDGDGGFPRTIEDIWDHADLDEVRRECRAQIERAIVWGFDVSHLSSHVSAMSCGPSSSTSTSSWPWSSACRYACRSNVSERDAGFPFRHLAAEEGVVFPDHFLPARRAGSRARVEKAVQELAPGVTEIHVQPDGRHARGAGHVAQLGGLGRRPRPAHQGLPASHARPRRRRAASGTARCAS